MTTNLTLAKYPPIRGGLESVVQPIGADENEWRKGVNVQSAFVGETFVSGYGGGSWGSIAGGDEKPVNQPGSDWDFEPVTIGDIFDCGALGAPGTPQGDIVRLHAERLLERKRYRDLAAILHSGEAYPCGSSGPGGYTLTYDVDTDTLVIVSSDGADFTNVDSIGFVSNGIGSLALGADFVVDSAVQITVASPAATKLNAGPLTDLDFLDGATSLGEWSGFLELDADGSASSLPVYNPGLQTVAELADGYDDDAPGSIRGVLQGLLDGVCDVWHTDPVFHVSRAWMPHFLGDIVRWDAATESFYFGPHRVSFDCYPNEGPSGTTTNADGSEVWIYASMPPVVGVGGSVEVLAARNARQNTYQVRAEQEAIIAFDATLVIAGKATVA